MPATSIGTAVRESADQRLQAIVAGHARAMLDRDSWRNTMAPGGQNAAPEPLLQLRAGAAFGVRDEACGVLLDRRTTRYSMLCSGRWRS